MRIFTASTGTVNFPHQQKLLVAGLQGRPFSEPHKTWDTNNSLVKIGHIKVGRGSIQRRGNTREKCLTWRPLPQTMALPSSLRRLIRKGSSDLPCENKPGTWHCTVSTPMPITSRISRFHVLGSIGCAEGNFTWLGTLKHSCFHFG